MAVLEILAAAAALTLLLYYYMTSTADFFAKRDIPHLPQTPLVGSSLDALLSRRFRGQVWREWYDHAKAHGHKFYGVFVGRRPTLFVCDVDMVKTILVKDFQHVMDRGTYYDRKREPLSANLFNIGGGEWKALRSKLTPTFTSGKMKSMFYLVRACTDELERYLGAEVLKGGDVEMAEVMGKFSTDVIASCAFGVEANALKDPDSEFRSMGRKVVEVDPLRAIVNMVAETMPWLRPLLPMPLLRPDVKDFFIRTFNENVEYRERQKVARHDFIDLLIQLKNDKTAGLEDAVLPAQAFVFYLAGFETSSAATSTCLVELAHHPDIQERLRDEVDRVLAKHGGITYEALHDMTYMEQCIEETMRLYPALAGLPRVVTRDYQLPGESPRAVLPAGTRVIIPTYAIHCDPEFYPDPMRFDPERFTEENKRSRPHYAYLPFGEGPRICIGLRFAMMQMKTSLAMILSSYRVFPSPKSVYPARFEPKTFVTKLKGGNRLKITKR
ncbi:Cytochrome P450 CYP6 [Frankliniella occidentalis]|uniref:Cytochrome P450 6a2-like n=1 Tax=Frankliniella occidentalis TaxID=133901 RepID=A0A6J1THX5_FRAOC|nr:cytochrome P450 6a2-like [Frankliniella occidentalis]KAE8746226.1 Cytochrome P450 CYP6 [Frankliniella occidentalis]